MNIREMSIRDYFAIHAPGLEPAYICEVMGWEKDLPLGDGGEIGDQGGWQDTVMQRWHELPFATRAKVSCQHAYAYADAMLEAGGQ